jgi:hypothetical protein
VVPKHPIVVGHRVIAMLFRFAIVRRIYRSLNQVRRRRGTWLVILNVWALVDYQIDAEAGGNVCESRGTTTGETHGYMYVHRNAEMKERFRLNRLQAAP